MLQLNIFQSLPIEHGFSHLDDDPQGMLAEMNHAKQIHSDLFVTLDTAIADPRPEADALLTAQKKLPVAVQTADCVPVLVAATQSGKVQAVAAIHAGWRGTAKQISSKVLHELTTRFTVDTLHVAIGPSISGAKYEVGQDVADQFPWLDWQVSHQSDGKDKYRFDVADENIRQISAFSREKELVLMLERSSDCTYTHATRYPSYRRDGKGCGRIVSYITIK